MRSVLFLDVDGVLNTPATWGSWRQLDGSVVMPVEPHLVAKLRELCQELDCTVVVHSTWREICTREQFVAALGSWLDDHLAPGDAWRTCDGDKGASVVNYLTAHGVVRHAVLDDDWLGNHPINRVVVSSSHGLSRKPCEAVRRLLGEG